MLSTDPDPASTDPASARAASNNPASARAASADRALAESNNPADPARAASPALAASTRAANTRAASTDRALAVALGDALRYSYHEECLNWAHILPHSSDPFSDLSLVSHFIDRIQAEQIRDTVGRVRLLYALLVDPDQYPFHYDAASGLSSELHQYWKVDAHIRTRGPLGAERCLVQQIFDKLIAAGTIRLLETFQPPNDELNALDVLCTFLGRDYLIPRLLPYLRNHLPMWINRMQQCNQFRPPLWSAVRYRKVEAMEVLLQLPELDLTITNMHGDTILHEICTLKNVSAAARIVPMWIRTGTPLDIKNNCGQLPLDLLKKRFTRTGAREGKHESPNGEEDDGANEQVARSRENMIRYIFHSSDKTQILKIRETIPILIIQTLNPIFPTELTNIILRYQPYTSHQHYT